MALTTDQLSDFRADVGDQTAPYAFTDAELERLYVRAADDYPANPYAGAVAMAFGQLLSNAAKLNDYVAGQTQEKKSQIFAHLKERLSFWEAKAANKQQIAIVGMRSVPPRIKDAPGDTDVRRDDVIREDELPPRRRRYRY